MKICAVIVTYNRIKLLKVCLEKLKNQTVPLNEIVVVNNSSTDGTKEWLDAQEGITAIHQSNLGGAGGFYTGIKYAHQSNIDYDWIWIMDDDVNPANNCLENLLKYSSDGIGVLLPLRQYKGQYLLTEFKKMNFENPFKKRQINQINASDISKPVNIATMPFEGPLIKRELVDMIGYPNKYLFIFYDDTEYACKTIKAGYKIQLIPSAILNKELLTNTLNKSMLDWRQKYLFRNSAYIDSVFGLNIVVRYIRPFGESLVYILKYAVKSLIRKGYVFSFKSAFQIMRLTYRGIRRKLGAISNL